MCQVDHTYHVSLVLQATAVPSDPGLTTVPGTHAEFVSIFAGTNINNCIQVLTESTACHAIFYY